MQRSRTINWQDPMEGISQIQKLSGLEYLGAISDGKIPFPPLLYTLDFAVAGITKGQAIFSFQPQEFHYNTIGTVHGGVIAAILDSAMGCSLHSLLEPGMAYTTLELKINFLKAVTIKTGILKATGNIIHLGKSTALVEAQLTDENGKIYAHAVSTCLILKNQQEQMDPK